MLLRFYVATAGLLILLMVVGTCAGWEAGHPKGQVIPASVRNSPGGYRSFHFWHTGYHGGK